MKAFRNPADQQVYLNVPDLIHALTNRRDNLESDTQRKVVDWVCMSLSAAVSTFEQHEAAANN